MNLNIILFIIGWTVTTMVPPDLATVRKTYQEAADSEVITKQMYDEMLSVGKNDNPTLIAYKGAVATLMSKYAEGIKAKKTFFKEGKELLEYAITKEPENVEIRCVRLSVQENVPKITGYKKNIEEDKEFVLDHFDSMTDSGAKNFVQGYVQLSDAFSDTEKQLF